MMKLGFTLILFWFSHALFADETAMAFYYQEKETGTPIAEMRYLVTDNYLRIDEGKADNDFILFDLFERRIYSVNHEEQTAMLIKDYAWVLPEHISREIKQSEMKGAPRVMGKKVKRYQVYNKDKLCTEVQYAPNTHMDAMKVFYEYQLVLSGQQVEVLGNTPLEMRGPCFLVDQVYNDGEYYLKGLPIQVWHSRGYARMLIDVKEEKVSDSLFEIPDDYRVYNPYMYH